LGSELLRSYRAVEKIAARALESNMQALAALAGAERRTPRGKTGAGGCEL
jgi:hypothetical protein